LVSNTSFYHRKEETGYEGTLYNLGFYQSEVFFNADGSSALGGNYPLLDGNGIHLPAGATNYTSPASVDNGQQNFAQEIRLQSKDTNSRAHLDRGHVLRPEQADLSRTDS
jgi:iron complex outermembrane receptor protein